MTQFTVTSKKILNHQNCRSVTVSEQIFVEETRVKKSYYTLHLHYADDIFVKQTKEH